MGAAQGHPAIMEFNDDVFTTFGLTKEIVISKTRCVVYLCRAEQDESVKKAVKVRNRSAQDWRSFYREVEIMRRLSHPNVMTYEQVGVFPDHLGMVMPYCDNGTLSDAVGKVGWPNRVMYFHQLCLAVKYVHGRRIIHRDIKLRNILLDRFGRVLLSDFDLSCTLTIGHCTVHRKSGTVPFQAPEMIMFPRGSYDGYKLDMYALGVVLYCLLMDTLAVEPDDFLDIVRNTPMGPQQMPYHRILEYLLHPSPKQRWYVTTLVKELRKIKKS